MIVINTDSSQLTKYRFNISWLIMIDINYK